MSLKPPAYPPMSPVTSTHINALGYDNRGLFVRFKDGAMYSYAGVPKAIHDQMLMAESVGRFFQQKIKGEFSGTKLESD